MANLITATPRPPCAIAIGGEPYEARYLNPTDTPALIDLHQAIFGGDFNAAWYAWKYHHCQNPSLGLWNQSGQLIAHCGGVKRTLWIKQKPIEGLQITDVMVHPQWRAILSRQGPFYWVCYLLYHDQIGPDRATQLGYGFPSLRHLQLATKLHLSFDGGTLWQMHWPSASFQTLWFWQYTMLNAREPGWSNAIERAWRTMQAQSQHLSLGERSAANLHWRYVLHPAYDYAYLCLRRPWSNTPTGIAVVRPHPELEHGLLWLDWIGSPDRITDGLAMVRGYAHTHHYTEVLAWGSHQVRTRLQHTLQYSESAVAGLGIPTASCDLGQPMKEQPWWWMAGDTDFL